MTMVDDNERYAEMSHGLFPRFVLVAMLLALLELALFLAVTALVPIRQSAPSSINVISRNEALEVISYVYPLVFFGLFYYSSRVRVNLGNDYWRVMTSIFIGALIGTVASVFLTGGIGTTTEPLGSLIQNTGAAVLSSLQFTFIGFASVFLSFKRRM